MKKNPNPFRSSTRANLGFTLVELLVVITIIAVLAAAVFAIGPRMRKRGEVTKSMQNMRQIGQMVALYSSENSGRIPPMQSETPKEGGGYTTRVWNLLLLDQLYPSVAENQLKDYNWWQSTKPIFLNPMMPKPAQPSAFKNDKTGYGINSMLYYNFSNNAENDWVVGKGGSQSIGIPMSFITEPARTALVGPRIDFIFRGQFLLDDNVKPFMVDNKTPILFVDGHIESMTGKEYATRNLDNIPPRRW